MDVTGAYALLGYSWELELPHGVQVVDGAEEGRRAVREQLSHGADWIKVYSDRGNFVRPDGVLEDIPTFTLDELRAIVDETHRQRHKVASHATGINGVHNSVAAGVDTVEHGTYIAPEDLKTMAVQGTWYVPTPYLAYYRAQMFPQQAARIRPQMKIAEDTFRRAMAAGVRIAYGTDAGAFEWTISPAVQFPVMVQYGMTPMQAIQSATIHAAELLGLQDKIGSLEPGKLADMVAVQGDPLTDITVLQKVAFVMKGGEVVKKP
jgi:imidazolonepropionase-like amidohydrolase